MPRRLQPEGTPIFLIVFAMFVILAGIIIGGSYYHSLLAAPQSLITGEGDSNVQQASVEAIPEVDRQTYGSLPALTNPDFFKATHDRLVNEQITFVEADLSEMKLRYYEHGTLNMEMPIKTKGREGSWWETPAGLYKAESKLPSHYSAFGKVYMPWNIPFQGNFFIHGWPYYADGTPVSSSYSGGCIRLSTEDAKRLYDVVGVDTPILVFEKDFAPDAFTYSSPAAPDAQHASSEAPVFLAADLKNNFVFAESNSTATVPIASITKLMTALVAVEYINIENNVIINKSMIVPTSKPRLVVGERYSVYDLLHPLLTESSNEAAEAIAQRLGRKWFINLMNQKAKAIGMDHSVFVDPAGREAGNVSTAQDLFALAKYLHNNRSFILKITSGTLGANVYGASSFTNLQNFNIFKDDPDFIGGKVGQTEAAHETDMSVFVSELQGEERPYVIIVLGSNDNERDARNLYEWVKTTY